MCDLDPLYLQALALLQGPDDSADKLVNMCSEVIAASEWGGINFNTVDLSNVVSKLPRGTDDKGMKRPLSAMREDKPKEEKPSKAAKGVKPISSSAKGVIMSPVFGNSLATGKRMQQIKKDAFAKKLKK